MHSNTMTVTENNISTCSIKALITNIEVKTLHMFKVHIFILIAVSSRKTRIYVWCNSMSVFELLVYQV